MKNLLEVTSAQRLGAHRRKVSIISRISITADLARVYLLPTLLRKEFKSIHAQYKHHLLSPIIRNG
jgi:hypothetical protein